MEWSLKTILAPWSYVASVVYHDSFWYPVIAKKRMAEVLDSSWGHLFRNWEQLTPDEQGFPTVGEQPAELNRTGLRALWRSMGIIGTAIKEAPEFAAQRRHHHTAR